VARNITVSSTAASNAWRTFTGVVRARLQPEAQSFQQPGDHGISAGGASHSGVVDDPLDQAECVVVKLARDGGRANRTQLCEQGGCDATEPVPGMRVEFDDRRHQLVQPLA
jgi:hypothetical protein